MNHKLSSTSVLLGVRTPVLLITSLLCFVIAGVVSAGTQLFFDDFDGTALDTSQWSVFVDIWGVYNWPYVAGGLLHSQGYHTRIDSITGFAPVGQSVTARARIRLAGDYHKFGFAPNPNERAGPITGYYFDTHDVLAREHYVRAIAWSVPGSFLLDVEIPVTWYEFHEFAIERTPSEVIYSIDGQEVARVADAFGGALPVGVWNDRSDLMQTDWVEVEARRSTDMVWVYINDPGVPGHEGFTGYMSKYETTNAQYCQYLNAALADGSITVSGGVVSGPSETYFYTYESDSYSQITYTGGVFSVRTRDGYSMAEHPVVCVSWYGATAFCDYYGYRLPTEWEWQTVADYDGTYTYGCGTSIDSSKANYWVPPYANPLHLTSDPYTSNVGYYPAYGYGMCDMAGNLWEWTSSGHGSYRVVRGGSWHNTANYCTVSYQNDNLPIRANGYTGFRVASVSVADQHTLAVSTSSGGTVTHPGLGNYQYNHGSTVPIVATPAANHHFVNWTGTAVAAGKVANPAQAATSVTVDADYTLQANFATGPGPTIDIEFVTIGHAGNLGDTRTGTDDYGQPVANPYGCGAVGYGYRTGKYEVTNAQWKAFTDAAGAPTGNDGGYIPIVNRISVSRRNDLEVLGQKHA